MNTDLGIGNRETQSPLPSQVPLSASFGIHTFEDIAWPQYNYGPAFLDGSHLDFHVPDAEPSFDYESWPDPIQPSFPVVSEDVHSHLAALAAVVDAGKALLLQDTVVALNTAFACLTDFLPLFHRPTFDYEFVQSDIRDSIFCLGFLLSPASESFELGRSLLRKLHGQILRYVETNTIYAKDLWVLQTMLILEFCSMYYADRTAMELGDIFHGTLVTLCRRLNLFEAAQNDAADLRSPRAGDDDPWHTWIETESRKRVAYYVFVFDVQHALFFGHKRSILSAYTIKLNPPCEEGEWQASNVAWTQSHQTQDDSKQLRFDEQHKLLISDDQASSPAVRVSSPLSLVFDLYGLASVALDFLQRHKDPFYNARDALKRLGGVLPAANNRLMAGCGGSTRTQGQTIYHIAVIALCTPLEDLEQAANDGFSRSGRTPKSHARASIIRLLTRQKVGVEPARHAVQLLRLYFSGSSANESQTEVLGNAHMMNNHNPPQINYSPYETSALYLGTLTLWAFVIGRVSDEADSEQETSSQDWQTTSPAAPTSSIEIGALLSSTDSSIERIDIMASKQNWRLIVQHVLARLNTRRSSNAQEYSQVLRNLSSSLVD